MFYCFQIQHQSKSSVKISALLCSGDVHVISKITPILGDDYESEVKLGEMFYPDFVRFAITIESFGDTIRQADMYFHIIFTTCFFLVPFLCGLIQDKRHSSNAIK